MAGKVILIKLGGSIVAPKHSGEVQALRKDVLKRVYKDIKRLKDEGYKVGIIFGAGNYGHPQVLGSKPIQAIKKLAGKLDFDEARKEMDRGDHDRDVEAINKSVSKLVEDNIVLAEEAGLKLKRVIHPRDVVYKAGKKDFVMGKRAIEEFKHHLLNTDTIPVGVGMFSKRDPTLYNLKDKVYSGDNMFEPLAEAVDPDMVIFATDVDGVFTANPQLNKDAKLMEEGTPSQLMARITSFDVAKKDASGAMGGKFEVMKRIAERGFHVKVVNGTVEGNIYHAATGKKEVGTHIVPPKRPRA